NRRRVSVGHLAVLLHIDAAAGAHGNGKLRPHGIHDRGEAVIEEIGCNPTRVIPILPKAEVPLGAEWPVWGRAEPALPIDSLRRPFRFDAIVPLARRGVAR